MKISANGAGMMSEFIRNTGAIVQGRFVYLPESMGAGFITGFSWGYDLRMMMRHYYVKEDISVEWTKEPVEKQEHIMFLLSGVFPPLTQPSEQLFSERPNVLVCMQAVSAVIEMPSNIIFASITLGVSRRYLHQLFGHIDHPVVAGVLNAGDNFILETSVSAEIIHIASEMLGQPVPGGIESHYYKLKCEELLCYVFSLLMEREDVPSGAIHLDDVKAIYAIKLHLQAHLGEPPNIALLARNAAMSEPKLRKLFRQTFGKGVFEYYQYLRMEKAARLLKEKKMTVSEVGYELGFTNLSHFSRVFEKYIGIKPKKYSAI